MRIELSTDSLIDLTAKLPFFRNGSNLPATACTISD